MAGNTRNAMPVPTESVEQISLFRWAAYQANAHPELRWLYHVPNGGHRSKATAGRLKAEGVKAGVPDIVLPEPCGIYHGLYIEMKRLRGSGATDKQSEWLEHLAERGYRTAVCRGWEAAAKEILSYLALREG